MNVMLISVLLNLISEVIVGSIVDNRITMIRSVVNLHKGTVAGNQNLLAATKNMDSSVVEFLQLGRCPRWYIEVET